VAQTSPKSHTTDGIRIMAFHRWKRFTAFIEQGRLNDFVWRGQNAGWPLLPKAARGNGHRGYSALSKPADMFRWAALGRLPRGRVDSDSEADWLALGQHHGLDTELLDWTSSPYVAAFFAYERPKAPMTPRGPVVYGLNRVLATIGETLLKGAPPEPSEDRVDFLRPFDEDNARLIHQGGLFTRLTRGYDLEEFVRRKFPGITTTALLLKLFLPAAERDTALKSLNRMRISHLTLFPDLHGAAQYCNLARQCEGYLPVGDKLWPLPDGDPRVSRTLRHRGKPGTAAGKEPAGR
jgi:hypothetical protein